MSDHIHFDTLDAPSVTEKKPKRIFLIVLAVFTFINAGLRIFYGLALLVVMSEFSNRLREKTPEQKWLTFMGYSMIISALISIIAVIMMLLEKRAGFWTYIGGQLVFLLASFGLAMLVTRSGTPGGLQTLVILAMFVLPLVNILLYALALRKNNAQPALADDHRSLTL